MAEVTRLTLDTGESCVDFETLDALEAGGPPGSGAEFVDDRLLEATERLVALERALEEERWSRAARAAHDVSAIAAALGLAPLSEQAEALRECCRGLDRVAAHAVGARVLRTGEATLSACLFHPATG